jgi:hypothetical protein
MATTSWNTNTPQASSSGTYEVLPTDTYTMKVAEAKVEENRFGTPDRDGKLPEQLVLTWEVSKLTPEQEEAGVITGEKVWQRMNTYLGYTKNGNPSKFLEFVQSLLEQKLIEPGDITPADFLGITQRVLVEEYTKEKGENAGKQGNRVASVAPLTVQRRQRPMVQPTAKPLPTNEEDPDSLPF